MPKNNSNGQAAVARMSDGKARIEMILSDKTTSTRLAFTLLEIIIVIAIIAVAALFAVPMFSQAADVQLRTAANMVAADIEYAKSLA
ncbi:MAG: prepilin-type N-terminal cleavage/methylation domain-containing protein, partial [Anaerohalosphaeraceae bacterium]